MITAQYRTVEQTGISIAEGYQCKSSPNILINVAVINLNFIKFITNTSDKLKSHIFLTPQRTEDTKLNDQVPAK